MAYKDPNDPRNKEAKLRWYYTNKERQIQRQYEYAKELRQVVLDFKDGPCTDCGIAYPYYVMQLDHVRGVKLHNPAQLHKTGSMRIVLEELAKCEVVCANCHAERTWGQTDLQDI